jgi:hypothetical protein
VVKVFVFLGAANEQAHLEFDRFKLSGNGSYALSCQHADYVSLFEIEDLGRRKRDVPIGRYCGVATPGPIKTRFGVHSLKMQFVTNEADVTNGFRGRYWFQEEIGTFDAARGCGANITDLTHGTIHSPNYDTTDVKVNKYPVSHLFSIFVFIPKFSLFFFIYFPHFNSI